MAMKLPADHPQRVELNDEVHARLPEPLTPPTGMIYVAMLSQPEQRQAELDHIAALCETKGIRGPAPNATHFVADFGPFRLKWERHTEFSRYQIIFTARPDRPYEPKNPDSIPSRWIETLPGELLVATRIALIAGDADRLDADAIAAAHFSGNNLIGSAVVDGAGAAFTDFQIHADGMGRLLVIDRSMTQWQAGRIVQRLLEIDTYRMMALLTLPVARQCGPFLAKSGSELADITGQLASTVADQTTLLERLMGLEADIETYFARTQYRFSAAAAYYELVRNRIADLRETRIEGQQTFREFTERRLAPAMSTCTSVAQRLNALSSRVARSTQLLSTRVAIGREQHNQALLATMARRAKLQLRLQQTVEGLSVAAITYYIVGLIGYAAKALAYLGVPISAEVMMGLGIPVVAVLVTYGVRGIRKRLGLNARNSLAET